MKIKPLPYLFSMGVIIMPLFNCNAADNSGAVRKPAVANSFYTGNPVELKKEIQSCLAGGKPLKVFPRIIISPHAGYVFSGPVAGIGYATIDKSVNKVILIGPSHHRRLLAPSVQDVSAFETPLGIVPLNKEDVGKLVSSGAVQLYKDPNDMEHSLEVQLPFLQTVLSHFTIIPILTLPGQDAAKLAKALFPLIDNKTLVVISSDFSHFNSSEEAKKLDKKSVETILGCDPDGFLDACGDFAIQTGIYLSRLMHVNPVLLDARNSYETAPQYGSSGRVVGYASIVFVPAEKSAENKTVSGEVKKNGKR